MNAEVNAATPALTDLHVHLPGTVRADTLADLAAAHGVELPLPARDLYERINSDPTEEEKPRGPWFPLLRVYELISASIRTRDDFARVTYEAMADGLAHSGVVYSEFAFSPSVHTQLGVPYAEQVDGIADGIERGRAELGVDARAIAAVNREDTPSVAVELVETVVAHPHELVPGIGLDFHEQKGPPDRFVEAFALAGRHGLKRTAHAGEHIPAAWTVGFCLDELGCDRLDHGYHVLKDPAMVERCAERGVVFNVAFTTSRRALRPWRRESIAAMVEAGLRASINSDDPALFPTTTRTEYDLAVETLGAERALRTRDDAVDAAFLDDDAKADLRAKLAHA